MTIFDALKMRFKHFDDLVCNSAIDSAIGVERLKALKTMQYSTAAALMGCNIHTLSYEIGDVDEARLFSEDAYDFGKYLGELEGKYLAKFYNNIGPVD